MSTHHTPFSFVALLRHGLVNVVFCCLVAAGLALSTSKPWDQQLAYSLAIGMTIWLTIDLGRFVVRGQLDHGWPAGLRGVALVVFGIANGFVVGSYLGDLYCGCSTWHQRTLAPDRLVTSLVITLFAGIGGAYFFHSRGLQKAQQTRIALAERDATEARLRLLQAQLEPHMLFNTLANLRVLIGVEPDQATRMLDHLVAFLRATLNASRATEHTLTQEFELLRDYLALMAVRMGPRLSSTLEMPAPLGGWPVPALLLQALVENSIQHGLEPTVEGGSVTVSARQEGHSLILEVRDTGRGLPPGWDPQGGGFGLLQVRERLKTRYGDAATLRIDSPASGGTSVRIALPRLPTNAPSPTEWSAFRTQQQLHTK